MNPPLAMNMTSDNLLECLQWRYATKVFDKEKIIAPDTWAAIEKSMVLTPSSFGLQPWKFITITCQKTKTALLEHSWNQSQVTDCSHMVVLCVRDTMGEQEIEQWLDALAATRGVSRDSLEGYAAMMHGFFANMNRDQTLAWAKNQVYIALGQLMTSAAVIGVDACPMEGIVPAEYDRILGLKNSGFATSVACAMGYRSDDDSYATLPKVRYPESEIIKTISS